MSTPAAEPARPPLICRDGDRPPRPGTVAAIGNFDGVHRGHQSLIAAARREAGARGALTGIVTFEPHPRDVLRPETPSFRLTPEPVKLRILGGLGVDVAFVRRFDRTLAATSAATFVGEFLAGELALSEVVVGGDFHFGRGREGTPEVLADLARRNGMAARVEGAVADGTEPVSSSRIRAFLEDGAIADANRLLGYRWLVSGPVVHGDARGRTLGYPTANMQLGPGCRLRHGIYAVRVEAGDGVVRAGVASYGRRPTFDDGAPLLEVHVFDYSGDLYGRTLSVEFLGFIRGEERFESADALIAAMDRDSAKARAVVAAGAPERSWL